MAFHHNHFLAYREAIKVLPLILFILTLMKSVCSLCKYSYWKSLTQVGKIPITNSNIGLKYISNAELQTYGIIKINQFS